MIDRNELECQMMIAHYADGPRLHTVSLSWGMTIAAKSHFCIVGSGSDLANYLLTESCEPNQDWKTNAAIAVNVIETVKRYDPYCGGPTKLGILTMAHGTTLYDPMTNPLGVGLLQPIVLTQSDTDEFVEIVMAVNERAKQYRKKIVSVWRSTVRLQVADSEASTGRLIGPAWPKTATSCPPRLRVFGSCIRCRRPWRTLESGSALCRPGAPALSQR